MFFLLLPPYRAGFEYIATSREKLFTQRNKEITQEIDFLKSVQILRILLEYCRQYFYFHILSKGYDNQFTRKFHFSITTLL